jgi:hypothetical protein
MWLSSCNLVFRRYATLLFRHGSNYIPHVPRYVSSVLVAPVEVASAETLCRVCNNTAKANEHKEVV